MNILELKHSLFTFGYVSLLLCLLTQVCQNNNTDNQGDTSSSEIQYDASYTFDSIYLTYNYSGVDNGLNNIDIDAGEFYVAHDTDPTKYYGTITELNKILQNCNNYAEDRQPKITITINPSYGGETIVHNCEVQDIGSDYVMNLPNLGANINSMIVKIESITTQQNNIKLIWSKTFDLNQGWWEFVEDKAMSGEAQIIVGGYTKVIGNERIYLVRITEDGQYQIVSYIEPTLLVDGMVECDIEIATPDTHPFPGLTDQPIFREDQPDNTITWAEPDIVIL